MEESLMKKFFKNPFVLTVIAIILGFAVAGVILLLAGFPPAESIRTLIKSMIGRPKDISSVVIRSTPIIFTGLIVVLMIALIALLWHLNSIDPAPFGVVAICTLVALAVCAGVIIACIERIKEIKGGELDEARHY